MTFLYPTFLFALFALIIPIIIHFFNLQKPKEIEFSNVLFLKHIQEVTASKIKIKHWLVLIARLLVLLFLILAFAQPVLIDNKLSAVKNSGSVAVYIDNSLSMSGTGNQYKSLDEGLKSINSIVDFFKPSTNFLLLTNDFDSKDFSFKNSDKIQERISEISFSPLHRGISEVTGRFSSLFKSNQEQISSVFFVSDFQKSTSGDFSKLSLDSAIQYYLLPVPVTSKSNVYVDSVWLEELMVGKNANVILKARVQNSSNESIPDVNLKLYLNEIQFSQVNTAIDAGGSSIIDFSISIKDTNSIKGFVQVEDNSFSFDNQYFFVMDVSSKIHVYNIFQDHDNSVSDVFGNEKIFDLTSSEVGEVNYSDWNKYDLVVLNSIDDIKQPLLLALKSFLKDGGSVVLIAGKKPVLVTYSNLVNSMAFSSVSLEHEDKKSFELIKPDIKNPFFKDVFEKDERNMILPFAYPTVKPAYRGNELLLFKNNLSFLSTYQSMNQGMVYLFSSPLDPEYTNFDKHALFVPVMYKIAFNSYKKTPQLAYSFDQKLIEILIEDEATDVVFSLEHDDYKVIPQQKKLNDRLLIELSGVGYKSGYYQLKSKNSVKNLALNSGRAESLMDFYTFDELKNIFSGNKNVQVLEVGDFEDFKSSFKNKYIGTPLWKYCLILALIFLLSEIVLLRFFR